jgi:glyceraldehyde 3-phosphate dehydrogenase
MKILLNGIGRIGKSILRIANLNNSLNIVAINELNTNIKNIAYTINYDSTYGNIEDKYKVQDDFIVNNQNKIQILNHISLGDIDYKSLDIDIIIDASGAKIDINILENLDVQKVFLSHPNKYAHINIILGVNENNYDNINHKVISTSSCNATALLPVLKIIDNKYGIKYGDITTIHPMLNHQKTLDSSCIGSTNRQVQCNFEFGRSSLQNIIPCDTTTIDACSYVLKNINEELISSNSFRVPTVTVGAINISMVVNNSCTKDELIQVLQEYEKNQKFKIILNNYDPLVSSDFAKQTYTSIIDHRFTKITRNKMIKLVLWYDNEYGYSSKVVNIVNNIIDTNNIKLRR